MFERSINQVSEGPVSLLEEFLSRPPCQITFTDKSKDSINAKQLLTLIYKGHKFSSLSFEKLLQKVLKLDSLESLQVH